MFRYYLKLGALSIRTNPALSVLMVLAIAIGIGACMTIVTVRHVMSDNPAAHKNDVLGSAGQLKAVRSAIGAA